MVARYNLKARLAAIDRKANDLIDPLGREFGLKVTKAQLSQAISGNGIQPKHLTIATKADEIVTRWEKHR